MIVPLDIPVDFANSRINNGFFLNVKKLRINISIRSNREKKFITDNVISTGRLTGHSAP